MHKAKKQFPPQAAALVIEFITATENRLEWATVDQDGMFLFNKNLYVIFKNSVCGGNPEDFSVVITSYQFITSFGFLHKIDELFSSF